MHPLLRVGPAAHLLFNICVGASVFGMPFRAVAEPTPPVADTSVDGSVATAQVIKDLLRPKEGLIADWKFESVSVTADALVIQFRFQPNNELLVMNVTKAEGAGKDAISSQKFAIAERQEAPQNLALARRVIERLSVLDPQWSWPAPSVLHSVKAPLPTPAAPASPPSLQEDFDKDWVIAEGQEQKTLAFVEPLRPGNKIPSRYNLDAIIINKTHIVLRYLDVESKGTFQVRLYHPIEYIEGAVKVGPVKLGADANVPADLLSGLREEVGHMDQAQFPWTYNGNSPTLARFHVNVASLVSAGQEQFRRLTPLRTVAMMALLGSLIAITVRLRRRQVRGRSTE